MYLDRWRGKIRISGDGCWHYIGSLSPKGYGRIGKGGKRANREMWKDIHGSIPENLHVLHSCNTPDCVNPDHLYLGTDMDNYKDRVRAGTQKGYYAPTDND